MELAGLKKTEARFRALADGSFDAFYILEAVRDTNGGLVDFTYADLNARAAERIGKPREQLLGTRLTDVYPVQLLRGFIERYDRVIRTLQPIDEEGPLNLPGVKASWVHLRVFPLEDGVAITSRDITDRKQDEAALRASELALRTAQEQLEARVRERTAELTQQIAKRTEAEDRFTALSNSGLIGIVIADASGNFVEVNDAFCRLVGYSREELLSGKVGPADLTPVEWASSDVAARAKLDTEGVAEPWEKDFLRKDGTRAPVLIGAKRLDATRVLVVISDLGERKHAEAALKHSEEQLRQSQKMEAVGSLAGGVAHDFNNLLTVILNHAWFLREGLHAGDPISENVQEVIAAAERAAVLTGQLLAFSRKQVLQPRLVRLNDVVIGIQRMLQRVIGEDIDFAVIRAPQLGLARVDPGQIEQVVMNLVVNARDAMPRGGQLTLETANVDLDVAYANENPGTIVGRHVMLAVSDTGTGMDPATRARIFEPFFTTKAMGKGTGLGLSTVFGIVQQSGGSINVYSELGVGTTFKVYFPQVVVEAEPAATSRAEVPGGARGAETVLLVEDDERVRSVVARILVRFGYQVLEATSGPEAVRLCEQQPSPIDLLLTDVVMPRMTGRELADRIKVLRPEAKILFMSGYTDSFVGKHGVLEPGTAFLQKPITVDTLTRKVREVLDSGQRP